MNTTTASAISATLRKGGLNPWGGSRSREGLRVSGSNPVVVTADFNSDRTAEQIARDAADILTEKGYTIRCDGHRLYVEGKAE